MRRGWSRSSSAPRAICEMPEAHTERAATPAGTWRRHVAKGLLAAFLLAVVVLVARQAMLVDWHEVLAAVRKTRPADLAAALVLTAASFTVYSCYDLLGRAYAGHRLATRQVMGVGFISYAFNLNLGSLIGGAGFRIRLYSKLGLGKVEIARVLALSLVTNWIGYMAVAGTLFASGLLPVPAQWKISSGGLRVLGVAFLAIVLAYVLACARSKARSVTVRGVQLQLPGWRLALLQLAVSMANWMLMGGVAWFLLGRALPYEQVFGTLMVGSVAGVIVHIPAGLGVLEAVFVALLAGDVSTGGVLAGVLAYRACYYLLPLAVAAAAYAVMEARHRRGGVSGSTPPARNVRPPEARQRTARRWRAIPGKQETRGSRRCGLRALPSGSSAGSVRATLRPCAPGSRGTPWPWRSPS